jgi:hypothetical protein
MMHPREILAHITAEPFQPFRIHTASGRDFDIRHPEFAQVGRSTLTVFAPDAPEGPERWHKLSLMLVESIESPVAAPNQP